MARCPGQVTVPRDVGQVKGKVRALHFWKVNCQELGNGTPWKTALRDRGAEQRRQSFKDTFCGT